MLILQADDVDFGRKLERWSRKGFPELGDTGGLGIGLTTLNVIRNPNFRNDPHAVSVFLDLLFICYVALKHGDC